jgi:F-type H+-transporting ATPase subunit delta
MRGASRASLADASDQLATVATTKAVADRVGTELFSVAALLDQEHGLRRALSDPSRQAAAKAALARTLLTGKVSAETVELTATLVSGRWSASRDLADAAEELGAQAVVISADRSRKLDDLEDDLFRFGRVVDAQPDLRAALTDPFLPADNKQSLIRALLDGKVSPEAEQLITQAAVAPRGRSLESALDAYAKLTAQRRERLVAVVRVAAALSQAQQDRLAAALAAVYGHEVILNIVLEPQVIGGLSIQVGDEFIDASVASRLAALRRRLAG